MKKTIYMDYNATTPLHGQAADAMVAAMSCVGNPSSVHRCGREARRLIEDARETIAKEFNVSSAWVIFTSGGTEADALALNGLDIDHVFTSSIEHSAVLSARPDMTLIRVNQQGVIDMAHLEELLQSTTDGRVLVSVMAANNETGALQPVKEITELVHKYNGYVHCDGVQLVKKSDIDLSLLNVDLFSVSAHKFGGPKGVGALLKRPSLALQATLKGGGQEKSFRGGTENLLGIVGMAAALKVDVDWKAIAQLKDVLEKAVRELGGIIFSSDVERLPNTLNFAYPGITSERQVMALDLENIMISAGSACSSGKVKKSHVLDAMGVEDDLANCAVRVSLGWETTQDDVNQFIKTFEKLVQRVEKRKTGNASFAA